MSLPASYIREQIPATDSSGRGPNWYTWILDNHWDFSLTERTYLGQLVYEAKYGDDFASLERLKWIAVNALRQIRTFGLQNGNLATCGCVLAVPSTSTNTHSKFQVPREISKVIAEDLQLEDLSSQVWAKTGLPAAKMGALRQPEDFTVEQIPPNSDVLIVDDLIFTGHTMSALGVKLRAAGAQRVSGFCLTKVKKGLGN